MDNHGGASGNVGDLMNRYNDNKLIEFMIRYFNMFWGTSTIRWICRPFASEFACNGIPNIDSLTIHLLIAFCHSSIIVMHVHRTTRLKFLLLLLIFRL